MLRVFKPSLATLASRCSPSQPRAALLSREPLGFSLTQVTGLSVQVKFRVFQKHVPDLKSHPMTFSYGDMSKTIEHL